MGEIERPPIMVCGCQATGKGKKAGETEERWACVIHTCFDIAEEQPSLVGRIARCGYYGKPLGRKGSCWIKGQPERNKKNIKICKCETGSEKFLPFFKYKGPGSYEAVMRCKNCDYLYQAHEKKKKSFTPHSSLKNVCDTFEPHGPYEYDTFYCGCAFGWD